MGRPLTGRLHRYSSFYLWLRFLALGQVWFPGVPKNNQLWLTQYRSRIYCHCHGAKEAVWLRFSPEVFWVMLKTVLMHHCDNIGSNILLVTLIPRTLDNILNIQHFIMFANKLKPATFTMHISPPQNIADVSPNLFHAQNSKNSRLIWACAMTSNFEGGCWKWASGMIIPSSRSWGSV